MIPEPILMYIAGVLVGAGITTAIVIHRNRKRTQMAKLLLTETIGQHAYLKAAREIVDDETDEEIAERGAEILEEYDLDAADPEVIKRVE